MSQSLRLTSYNIRKAVGLDWRRDPQRVISVIGETGADVAMLQEADKRLGARPSVLPDEDLASAGYRALAPPDAGPSHGWHGNVVLVRQALGESSTPEPITLPGVEPRGALALSLPQVTIIGAHLALTPVIRLRQIAALRDWAAAREGPLIICGDFNDWGRIGAMRLAFGSGYRVVAPGPSFHASRPMARLDRFILRGAVRNRGARVHQSTNAALASDHLPIVIDVDVAP